MQTAADVTTHKKYPIKALTHSSNARVPSFRRLHVPLAFHDGSMHVNDILFRGPSLLRDLVVVLRVSLLFETGKVSSSSSSPCMRM